MLHPKKMKRIHSDKRVIPADGVAVEDEVETVEVEAGSLKKWALVISVQEGTALEAPLDEDEDEEEEVAGEEVLLAVATEDKQTPV